MRIPFTSERSAFWIALGFTALVGVSVGVGFLVSPPAGGLVFAAGVVAAVVADALTRDPSRRASLREAAHAPHPHGAGPGDHHFLIVANDGLAGEELRDEIVRRARAPQLDILAPVRCSRAHYLSSDYDREAADARARLAKSLAWAADQGFEAHGEVGDPDPVSAIEDELRDFGAEAVIFVAHPEDSSTWLDARELERLRAELDVPVSQVEVR
jgi:hypothetical protein